MKLILFLIAVLSLSFVNPDEVYNQPLKNIDGNTIDLNAYRGKKIIFIILPLSTQDSSVSVSDVINIQAQVDSLVIIGVPSIEMGYTNALKANLKSRFSGAGSNFILADAMNVRKTSGTAQAPLFQWLTKMEMNQHFNMDVKQIGDKFLVNSKGRLFAVIGPQLKLSSSVLAQVLAKPRFNN
jgi:glutathione peroxidase